MSNNSENSIRETEAFLDAYQYFSNEVNSNFFYPEGNQDEIRDYLTKIGADEDAMDSIILALLADLAEVSDPIAEDYMDGLKQFEEEYSTLEPDLETLDVALKAMDDELEHIRSSAHGETNNSDGDWVLQN